MKKLLKLNSQYPISIGFILFFVGFNFFDVKSDIRLGFILLGGFIGGAGSIIGFIQSKKR